MRILVLDGTAWLGGAIVRAALDRGHDVTCVARGESGSVPDGAKFVSVDRDDDGALAALVDPQPADQQLPDKQLPDKQLADQQWDAVIDVARQPGHVRRAVRDLRPRASRYLFVSTASVYADQRSPNQDEYAPLLAPLESDYFQNPGQYGRAKVACEELVRNGFGAAHSLIARAGLISGPGDTTGRTTYWPERLERSALDHTPVLAPDAPSLVTQTIDVRDLAEWLVRSAEDGTSGTYNAIGNRVLFGEFLALIRRCTGRGGDIVWADGEWLEAQGVANWGGPRSFPLWLSDHDWLGMMDRNNESALSAGLTLRPPEQTVSDTLEWLNRLRAEGINRPGDAGLTPAEEARLIARL